MNELNINNNWNEKKKRLKEQFAELTDRDLRYSEDKEQELIRRVQQRIGATKVTARALIRKA